MCELKKDDPMWDATQTVHYVWMLKTGGPQLERYESFMMERGWVRPSKPNVHVGLILSSLYSTIRFCGVSERDPKALFALAKTFETVRPQ